MRLRNLVILIVAVALGLGGWWLARTDTSGTPTGEADAHTDHGGAPEPESAAEPKVLYYYDPMRPDVHFDAPGKSPFMDMELVPKYAAETSGEGEGVIVEIDPRMVQNLGVRTAPVTLGTFSHSFDAVGAVEADERLIYALESRAEGWVERLDVRAVGDPVRRGQAVAGVYSPDLYSAQQELVLAAKSGDPSLLDATRQRLTLLGMPESQIQEVLVSGRAQRQTRIVAANNGVVTELNVREGQKVMPGMPIIRIADLSRVWITVEVPESLSSWLRQGGKAEARLAALPGRTFEGRVDYVYPGLDTATRTVRARLVFQNRDAALKPGMYANVAVLAGTQQDALQVPTEAVIRTGKRTVVIVAEAEGRFRPVEVTLGQEHEGTIVILSGLAEGQHVVTSGQFLIDSEASLRGAYRRFEGEAPKAGHSGHAP